METRKGGRITIGNQTTAAQALRQRITDDLAAAFTEMLDEWHAAPETWDNALDALIHRQYADVLAGKPVFPPRDIPYFSPSSANSCPRELYVKLTGGKRDVRKQQPHQGRWQRLGTAVGDIIQRDLLFIEKHSPSPRFVPKRTPEGYPTWEDFAKKAHVLEHRGHKFAIYGAPDGILIDTETGEYVGLEVKSKQTTAAQTSLYSMREPQTDHAKQTIAYSIMYDVDDYIIVYVNGSKRSWSLTDEEYAKNPDLRAFHVKITDADRLALLDSFTDILDAVEAGTPPPLDLTRFTFNNYKTACALSLTNDEFAELQAQARLAARSNMPDWRKAQYVDAVAFIENVRKGAV